MAPDLVEIYDRLYAYCAKRGFAGHDPFDGLNSRLFQLTPLKYGRLARLAWLQVIKRSPLDLRRVLFVPKGMNAKALALFALAETSRFRSSGETIHRENAVSLLDMLLQTRIEAKSADGKATAAFGYNFDWQSRHFYAPQGTPAIVPSAFAARALIEGYETLGDERYLAAADEICTFIVTELNRVVDTEEEVCFSYTPLDRSCVYNASLLAGETLARVGAVKSDEEYPSLAARTARFVIDRQRAIGAWAYGEAADQQWVDNFHTAYVLMSLTAIASSIAIEKTSEISNLRSEITAAVERGYAYWRDNFFLPDGTPKYYGNEVYPIDTHASAVAIVVFCNFDDVPAARRVAEWTVNNMLDRDGYFYYQVRRSSTIKTSFMRWSQAWMAYALAVLIESEARV